ncbi:MAG: hypothetical protein RLN62_00040 [Rickettsiales bacterium]
MIELSWKDPVCVAEILSNKDSEEWVFLHSSQVNDKFSRYSIISFGKEKEICGANLADLKKKPWN